MLIIIEGPDGAGKSTLATNLMHALTRLGGKFATIRVIHRGPPTSHPLIEYENPLFDYRPGTGQHIICDRWHLGELVYPHLLKRRTSYNVAVHRHVDLFLQSRGALVIYLEPTRRQVIDRLATRYASSVQFPDPIEVMTIARWDEVSQLYHSALEVSGVKYDDYCSVDPPIESIIDTAAKFEQRTSRLNEFVTYVGPPSPSILLLGETRGVRGRFAEGLAPAFLPYPSTSGHYLLSHLNVLGFSSIGLANACDVDDPVALWKALGEPSVVALGKTASRRCDELGLSHASAPHPQYVRRFHHAYGHLYADVIREAARTNGDLSSWRP